MSKYCVCFCRVSTIQQDLSQQTAAIRAEARKMGYSDECQIVIEYKESGISLSSDEREGISALKSEIEKNPDIDCVICWELSRIGRRADVIYDIRDFLVNHGIQWIVLTPYMKLLDENGKISPTASMMMAIFTSIAETEMEIKKERSIRGRKHAQELGRYIGGTVTFGYRVNKDKYWEIKEEDASIVRTLFELYSTGNYSYHTLALELKERGAFPEMKLYSLETRIAEMIQMKLYYGETHYPPIISKELYDKCQIVRKSHVCEYRISNVSEMICKQLLINKHTGHMLSCKGKTNLAKYNHDRSIYVSSHHFGRTMSILQHAIDPVVWEFAKELYVKYVMNRKVLQTQIKEKGKILTKKYTVANSKVITAQQRIDKVEERIIVGNISEEKANDLLSTLKTEKRDWQSKADKILLEISENISNMKSLTEHSKIDLDSLSFKEKYDIVHKMIEKVELSKPNTHIRYTLAEIYTKVDNKVYVYGIYTNAIKWKLLEVKKREV